MSTSSDKNIALNQNQIKRNSVRQNVLSHRDVLNLDTQSKKNIVHFEMSHIYLFFKEKNLCQTNKSHLTI